MNGSSKHNKDNDTKKNFLNVTDNEMVQRHLINDYPKLS